MVGALAALDVDDPCLESDRIGHARRRVPRKGGSGEFEAGVSREECGAALAVVCVVSEAFCSIDHRVGQAVYHETRRCGSRHGAPWKGVDGAIASRREARSHCRWPHEQLGMECADLEPKPAFPDHGPLQEVERCQVGEKDEGIAEPVWVGDGSNDRRPRLDERGPAWRSSGRGHGV